MPTTNRTNGLPFARRRNRGQPRRNPTCHSRPRYSVQGLASRKRPGPFFTSVRYNKARFVAQEPNLAHISLALGSSSGLPCGWGGIQAEPLAREAYAASPTPSRGGPEGASGVFLSLSLSLMNLVLGGPEGFPPYTTQRGIRVGMQYSAAGLCVCVCVSIFSLSGRRLTGIQRIIVTAQAGCWLTWQGPGEGLPAGEACNAREIACEISDEGCATGAAAAAAVEGASYGSAAGEGNYVMRIDDGLIGLAIRR